MTLVIEILTAVGVMALALGKALKNARVRRIACLWKGCTLSREGSAECSLQPSPTHDDTPFVADALKIQETLNGNPKP